MTSELSVMLFEEELEKWNLDMSIQFVGFILILKSKLLIWELFEGKIWMM